MKKYILIYDTKNNDYEFSEQVLFFTTLDDMTLWINNKQSELETDDKLEIKFAAKIEHEIKYEIAEIITKYLPKP